jgi:hypothetical protein
VGAKTASTTASTPPARSCGRLACGVAGGVLGSRTSTWLSRVRTRRWICAAGELAWAITAPETPQSERHADGGERQTRGVLS